MQSSFSRVLAMLGLLFVLALTAGCGGGSGPSGGGGTASAAASEAPSAGSPSPSPVAATPAPSPSPSPAPPAPSPTPTAAPSPSPTAAPPAPSTQEPPAPPSALPAPAATPAAAPDGNGFVGLQQGWNLVTVPADTVTAAAAATNLYSFDTGAGQYVAVDPSQVEPGRGYWAYSAESPGTLAFTGTQDSQILTAGVEAGWNLVGLPSREPVRLQDVTLDGSPLQGVRVFTWNGSAYEAADLQTGVIRPRQGFWLFAPVAGTLSTAAPAAHVDMGINLDVNRDWARELVFVDCMKSARRFGTPGTPWDQAAPVDENGWPIGDFGSVIFSNIPNAGGAYHLSWQGTGTVASLDRSSTVQNAAYDPNTDTSTAQVLVNSPNSPQNTYGLMLRWTGTRDGARNIRLTRPGYPAGTQQTFHTPFLQKLERFRLVRFMQFLSTQETRVQHWADRTLPTDATQTGWGGVAYEHCIDMANETGMDLWICIPDEATDDYVRELARLLKGRLDPNLAVYIEWTNEPWNWNPAYPQTRRNADAARIEGNAGPSALNDDGATMNEGYWAWRRWARRTREISNLFREVYGDASMMTRVRPVLSPQYGYQYMAFHQLEWLNRIYGAPRNYLYAIAGAPYFGPSPADRARTDLTVDDVITLTGADADRWRATFRNDPTFTGALTWGNLPWQPTLARYYGLHCLAYEGGPDTSGPESLDAKVAAQHDPRMGDLIRRFVGSWYANGNEMFVYFKMAGNDRDPNGSMGIWPDITQETVKGQALLDLWNTPPSALQP